LIKHVEEHVIEAHVDEAPRFCRAIKDKPPAQRLDRMPGKIGQDKHVRADAVVIVNLVIVERTVKSEGLLRLGNEDRHLFLLCAEPGPREEGFVSVGVIASLESLKKLVD